MNSSPLPAIPDLPPFPPKWAEKLPQKITENALRLRNTLYIPCSTATRVFPPAPQVFRAMALTTPDNLRAVILGQDPYPTFGHANGLCFSVAPDVRPLPPSLRNIFREYTDCLGFPTPSCGDLTPWAKQGILLLNTVLTVPEGCPNGHQRIGWQSLTDAILQICLCLPGPTVFLLWGREAQNSFQRAVNAVNTASMKQASLSPVNPLLQNIPDSTPLKACFPKHDSNIVGAVEVLPGKYALRSSHPSPLGASRPCGDAPAFLGSRPFSQTNALLGEMAVNWRLP